MKGEKEKKKPQSRWREKSASDNLLKELLENTATVLQRCRSVSLVIYLKHCGDDVGCYMRAFGFQKNQCYCSTSDRRNRYSKAKKGVGIKMQMCFLHSVTPMHNVPQIKNIFLHNSSHGLPYAALWPAVTTCIRYSGFHFNGLQRQTTDEEH